MTTCHRKTNPIPIIPLIPPTHPSVHIHNICAITLTPQCTRSAIMVVEKSRNTTQPTCYIYLALAYVFGKEIIAKCRCVLRVFHAKRVGWGGGGERYGWIGGCELNPFRDVDIMSFGALGFCVCYCLDILFRNHRKLQ